MALASCRSAVSNPSVHQPEIDARRSRTLEMIVAAALQPIASPGVSSMYRSARAQARGKQFACDSLCNVLV